MALGADRRTITRLVLGASMRLTRLGAAIGVAAALAGARAIRSQLFGIEPTDAPSYLAVVAAVLAAAALATWQPIRHACRLDPVNVLKAE
jgi:ABC-type lipoprotein release transport system permease subunit